MLYNKIILTVIILFSFCTYGMKNQRGKKNSTPEFEFLPNKPKNKNKQNKNHLDTHQFLSVKIDYNVQEEDSGYYALKDALLLADLAAAEKFEKNDIFNDETISKLLCGPNGLWVNHVGQNRKKQFFNDYVHDYLLLQLRGAQKIATNSNVTLRCEKGSISFLPLPQTSNLANFERKAIMALIPSIAQMLTETLFDKQKNQYTITLDFLYKAIKACILEQNTEHYRKLSTKIGELFPTLDHVTFSFEHEGLLYTHEGKFLARTYNANKAFSKGCLAKEEIESLVAFEKERGSQSLSTLPSIPTLILQSFDEFELDKQAKKFIDSMFSKTGFLGICFIQLKGIWVSCVVNRKDTYTLFMFLHHKLVTYDTLKKVFSFLSNLDPKNEHRTIIDLSEFSEEIQESEQPRKLPQCTRFKNSRVTYHEYVGELRQEVKDIIDILSNNDLYKSSLKKLPNMMLLYGPSGTGKSTLAKLIASESERPFAEIVASSLLRKHYGEAVEELKSIFNEARMLAMPVIIFIDEIDAILRAQTNEEQRSDLRHVLDFELDKADPYIFCIGTTNDIQAIDETTKRRCANFCIELPLPSLKLRADIISHYMQKLGYKNETLVLELAQNSNGFCCGDLEMMVTQAFVIMRRDGCQELTEDCFLKAFEETKHKVQLRSAKANDKKNEEQNDKKSKEEKELIHFAQNIHKVLVKDHTQSDFNVCSSFHALKNAIVLIEAFKKPESKIELFRKLTSDSFLSQHFKAWRTHTLLFDLIVKCNTLIELHLIHKFMPIRELIKSVNLALKNNEHSTFLEKLTYDLNSYLQDTAWDITKSYFEYITDSYTTKKTVLLFEAQAIKNNVTPYIQLMLTKLQKGLPDHDLVRKLREQISKLLDTIDDIHITLESEHCKTIALIDCAENVTPQEKIFVIDPILKSGLECKALYPWFINSAAYVNFLISKLTKEDHKEEIIALSETYDFEPLKTLCTKLKEHNNHGCAAILIPVHNRWVTCVIHKKQDKVTYYIMDSYHNTLDKLDKTLVRLIIFLNNNLLDHDKTTSSAPGKSKPRLGEILKSDETIAPLTTLFPEAIPSSIYGLIESLRNPTVLEGEYFNNLDVPLLLYGPSGCGKNTLVERLALESGREVLYVSGGDFTTKWQGSTQNNIKKLFKDAYSQSVLSSKGVILFIDHLDAIASHNDANPNQNYKEALTKLKAMLAKYKSNPTLFTIAASNQKEKLDKNVLSLFKVMKLGLPDYYGRVAIFHHYLKKGNIEVTKEGDQALSFYNKIPSISQISNYFMGREARNTQRVISESFLNLIIATTNELSPRDIHDVISEATSNFIHQVPFQDYERKNSLFSRICKKLSRNNKTVEKLLKNTFKTQASTIASKSLSCLTLDATCWSFFNFVKLSMCCLSSLRPMERYIYDALFQRILLLLEEENVEYKKQAMKYLEICKGIGNAILSGTQLAVNTKILLAKSESK